MEKFFNYNNLQIIMITKIEKFVILRVKEIRIKNNFTQSDLAEILSVTPGFIGKIESLKYGSKYNLNHLNKLSKYLNISPKEFFPENSL